MDSVDSANPLHPKRAGTRVAAGVIGSEPPLERVPDTDATWHDARTVECLDPRDSPAAFGGICLVESGTPVEIKAAIPEHANGGRSTTGRWLVKRDAHDQLCDAGGVYYLVVYAPQPPTPVLARLVVPAVTVGDHLQGSWYDNGREGSVAKLSWDTLIEPTEVSKR